MLSTLLPVTSPILLLLFHQGSTAAKEVLEGTYSENHLLHIATSIWNILQKLRSLQTVTTTQPFLN